LQLPDSSMVCEKCEKKLSKVITPDPWKSGARNTTEGGGRKVGENKLLTMNKGRYVPHKNDQFNRCRICRSVVHQPGSHYCQSCAYQKGICAMCGKKMLMTKNYRQSTV
ncbi:Cysteine-rich PDZ-binding protein, partial [Trichinella pseudospiralis]